MKIVINPAYRHLEPFVRQLPRIFGKEGSLVYAGRNTIKVFEEKGISVNVKSFRLPCFLNGIVYGFFRPSKARRSYEYGLKLRAENILTPTPIAYIEQKRFGLLRGSYYLSAHLEYDGMLRELRTGTLSGREDLLRAFARFTAEIHQHQIFHKDFSPGNILYLRDGNDYRFYLVDINRMKFCPVGMEKGCKNLQRLWGSEEMLRFLAREYARCRHMDAADCENLTLRHHRHFWKKYSARHKGFLPYLDS
ncbi:MAG: lipopolysaccharide kinase InaA family protein [Tannerellaceae bacterium]|jgi:hypothetical protein|nr:lipopolysaccharide kinase InaA family protein [Tannerellaceae bacterium]